MVRPKSFTKTDSTRSRQAGMKTIYFVRHGQSESNIGLAHGAESPLTARGQKQAQFMGVRAAELPIDCIIASTMTRARQTAAIIASCVGKEVADTSDLLVECRRTSEHKGKSHHDPESMRIDKEIYAHFTEPGYRYLDEENFDDLKWRAGEALAYLESRPEDHIMVITHGLFLRVLMSRALFGESLTAKECETIIRGFHTQNTGLTIFRHDASKPQPWWVWTWNDHAHLADVDEDVENVVHS